MDKKKELRIDKETQYSGDTETYTIRLKKRKKQWWWFLLLLLLPLLLLIRFNCPLTVYCYDADTNEPIEGAKVFIKYDYHYFIEAHPDGFCSKHSDFEMAYTDGNGQATFEYVHCNVFCYLFHFRSPMVVSAESECYAQADTTLTHHDKKLVELPMRQRTGLPVCVVDQMTYRGIPGARLKWKVGQRESGPITVDEEGHGELPEVPICFGTIEWIEASAEGYNDTVYRHIPIEVVKDSCLLIKMSREIKGYDPGTPSTGDVQILLSWYDRNDLDLKCRDPYGDVVAYDRKVVPSGGRLEIDMNVGSRISDTPIENIYWPHGEAPSGRYTVYVKMFGQRESSVSRYEVMVIHGDKRDFYEGVITKADGEIEICTFIL